MAKLHFGLELANIEPWPKLQLAASVMDSQLWRALYTYDHLIPCTAEELPLTVESAAACENGPILEGWTLLAALAATTKRVRLGSMVTAVTMRHPAVLAKCAVTVDHISRGRVDLGLGTGWHRHEHEAYGLSLGKLKERCDRFDEAIQVLTALLHQDSPHTFAGQYYQLDQAPFNPKPIQERLPILVAGGGEKRTLPTTAKYADACNLYGNVFGSRDEVKHKLQVLDGYCQALGRDPSTIRRTVTLYADIIDDPGQAHRARRFLGQHLYDEEADALPYGSPQRLIDCFASYIELNVDEIVLNGPDPTPEKLTSFNDEILSVFC